MSTQARACTQTPRLRARVCSLVRVHAHPPVTPPFAPIYAPCAPTRAPSAPRSPTTRVSLFAVTRPFTPTCHTPSRPPRPRPCTRTPPARSCALPPVRHRRHGFTLPSPSPLCAKTNANDNSFALAFACECSSPRTRRLTRDRYHTRSGGCGHGSPLPVQP